MVKSLYTSRNRIHIKDEKEIGTKDVMFIMSRTTLTNYNNQQPTTFSKGYKVTLYSDYLKETALYTIYKNSPNLGCPKGQCEYGHYMLVFDPPP